MIDYQNNAKFNINPRTEELEIEAENFIRPIASL